MKLGNSNAIYRFCGRALALAAACAAFWCAAPGTASAEMRVTAGVERFSWSEYSNGSKVLDESGPRYMAGFTWLPDDQSGWLFGYNGKYYWGDVTYTGLSCTADGTCSPYSAKNGYRGMLNEILLHYRLDSGIKPGEMDRHYLDLVTALGVDIWSRTIKGSGQVTGYNEDYTLGVFRFGLEMIPVGNGLRIATGLKQPVYVLEKYNGADLKPKPDLGYYISFGWRFDSPLSIVLDFDSYHFNQSNDQVPFQPESRMEVLTLRAGYSF